jgi:hypothetical protein
MNESVVAAAQQGEVVQCRGSAVDPMENVMNVAPPWWAVTSREGAAAVA